MTTLFGTLGFTPEKLLPSVSAHPEVERLVVYHDRHRESQKAMATVRAFCRDRGLRVESREIDAFDILDCATRMRRELRAADPATVVFNLTGGTPVLSSAATLACILEGARAVYVDERTGHEIALPLLTIRPGEILNPEQRRVLRHVQEGGRTGCSQADIGRALGLSRATVSHHVRNLKAKRLLVAEPDPDDARREVLRVLPSATLLLVEDEA